jgi:hypothetical protein
MSLTYDALEDCIAMLKDGWTAGTQLPDIKALWKEKSAGFIDDRRDIILVYPRRENIEYFGLYGSDFLHTLTLVVDVRSYGEQDKLNQTVTEVLRILKANIRRTGFVDVIVKHSMSQSDNLRNMFKHQIVVQYRQNYE